MAHRKLLTTRLCLALLVVLLITTAYIRHQEIQERDSYEAEDNTEREVDKMNYEYGFPEDGGIPKIMTDASISDISASESPVLDKSQTAPEQTGLKDWVLNWMNMNWSSGEPVEEEVGKLHRRIQSDVNYENLVTKIEELDDMFKQEGPSEEYHNLMNAYPPTYLEDFRNPCWVEELTSAHPYTGHVFFNHETLLKTRRNMEAIFEQRLNNGTRWRARCLPYFYIGGVQKCGTSDLFDKLALHPDISPAPFKEPHFWTRFRAASSNHGYVPISNYIDMFDEVADQIFTVVDSDGFHPLITGEASISTMIHNDYWDHLPENSGSTSQQYSVAHYIHHVTPNAKFLLIVRNPADRLFSDFLFVQQNSDKSPALFHEKVQHALSVMKSCLQNNSLQVCVHHKDVWKLSDEYKFHFRDGLYVAYLEEWSSVFPLEQIKVIRLEDYSQDRAKALQQTFEFLGLDPVPEDKLKAQLSSASISNSRRESVKNVEDMWESTRVLLDDFHRPYNERLAKLLNDDRFTWKDIQAQKLQQNKQELPEHTEHTEQSEQTQPEHAGLVQQLVQPQPESPEPAVSVPQLPEPISVIQGLPSEQVPVGLPEQSSVPVQQNVSQPSKQPSVPQSQPSESVAVPHVLKLQEEPAAVPQLPEPISVMQSQPSEAVPVPQVAGLQEQPSGVVQQNVSEPASAPQSQPSGIPQMQRLTGQPVEQNTSSLLPLDQSLG